MIETTAKRRWFRFGLRTLLIVVLLLSLPLGWFAVKLRQAERQRTAVEAIREAGGVVFYDYEFDEHGYINSEAEAPAPAWLNELVGEDFFSDVTAVSFPDELAGDVVLEHLTVLTQLESLVLLNTHVTDEGLRHVKGLTRLKSLLLQGTQVTDAGLANLMGIELELLALTDTQVTDAGLQHLKWLRNLEQLHLGGTHVKGIKELQEALPNCEIHWTNPNRN